MRKRGSKSMSIFRLILLFCSGVWLVSIELISAQSTYNLSLLLGPLIGGETDVTSLILLGDGLGNSRLVEVLNTILLGVSPLRSVGILSIECW